MQSSSISVRRLAVGPFQSNCYVVANDRAASAGEEAMAVVIDPGDEAERIAAEIERAGDGLAAILLTHAHLDHVGAVAPLVARYHAPVYLHPADRELYDRAPEQAAAFGLQAETPPPPDRELRHREPVTVGGIRFEVRHAPGHSPGGVVLLTGEEAFVGDCVFQGSIGRTDLPGGDTNVLLESIREQILTLPPETILHSGHGPDTTVARERASNPFLTGAFGWSG